MWCAVRWRAGGRARLLEAAVASARREALSRGAQLPRRDRAAARRGQTDYRFGVSRTGATGHHRRSARPNRILCQCLRPGGRPTCSAQLNLGYARWLNPGLSVDAGVVRAEYSSRLKGGRAAHYTEFYGSVTAGNLSPRLSISPDYFRDNITTLYGEIEGVLPVDDNWRMDAHAGALHYLDGVPNSSTQFDWRLGIARTLGSFDAFLNVSGGGGGPRYSAVRRRDRTALVAGISYAF